MAFPYLFPFILPDDGSGGAVISASGGLIHVDNHVDLALDRRAQYFKGKPNFTAILTGLLGQVQVLEDAMFDVFLSQSIDGAVEAGLDRIGRIVDQPRSGFDDATYRLYIKAKILLNKSNGTAQDIYRVFAGILPSGVSMSLAEFPPAGFELHLIGAMDPTVAAVFSVLLQKARAAGVGARLYWSVYGPSDTFTLDTGPGLDVGHLADAS